MRTPGRRIIAAILLTPSPQWPKAIAWNKDRRPVRLYRRRSDAIWSCICVSAFHTHFTRERPRHVVAKDPTRLDQMSSIARKEHA